MKALCMKLLLSPIPTLVCFQHWLPICTIRGTSSDGPHQDCLASMMGFRKRAAASLLTTPEQKTHQN